MTGLTSATDAIVLKIDPFSDAYLNDPYPAHEEIRQAGPVVRFDQYEAWGMARFQEVSAALLDWETYISSAGVGLTNIRKVTGGGAKKVDKIVTKHVTLQIDPPEHTKYRSVFTRILTPAVARQLRDNFARQAEEFVDDLLEHRTFDAMDDLAVAFPIQAFSDAIGLRKDGREKLLPWSDALFNQWGPDNELARESVQLIEKLYPWILESCSRQFLSPTGIGMKIYEAADRGELELQEAPFMVRPFMSAGLDTTVAGLGATLLGLATHPDQWALLRANPALARQAFEEGIRWESPIQLFCRTTSRAVTVGCVELPADAKVMMFMGAANRDPSRWEDPARYDINRKTAGHVGFGAGIHTCVGQMIARLEGEVMVAALAKRVKSIELLGEPTYKLNHLVRSLKSMPVRITPA